MNTEQECNTLNLISSLITNIKTFTMEEGSDKDKINKVYKDYIQ